MAEWQVIRIRSHLGAPQKGTEKGPDKIIDGLLSERKELIKKIRTVSVPKENQAHQKERYSRMKNLPEIKKLWRRVENAVYSVVASGDKALLLHGDDSVVCPEAWAIAAGMGKKKLGVIYFDAHGDANTLQTTRSGNFYGMGVAHMIGYGHPDLLKLNSKQVALSGRNLVMIGQRNFDPGEKEFLKDFGISIYTPSDVNKNITQILKDVKLKFKKESVAGLYVHFDQDVVDPEESGASLCRTPHGIRVKELLEIADFVRKNFDVVGVSIGNYLPAIDEEKKTLKVIGRFLSTLGIIKNL